MQTWNLLLYYHMHVHSKKASENKGEHLQEQLEAIKSYIIHPPWWKSIWRAKNCEEVMCPEVVTNIAKNYNPNISLQW